MKKSLVAFKNGRKLEPISMVDWNRALDPFEDGVKVTVTIETFKRKRSLSANNYFHFVIGMIAEETGEESKVLKDALKARFGLVEDITGRDGETLCDEDGEVLQRLKSTSDYTGGEIATLIDKIKIWAQDFLGIIIPDADTYRNYNINP